MAVVLHLYLEAHHAERNHHRVYDIALVQDLLGDWVVVVRYGRVGRQSRQLTRVAESLEEAQRVVRTLLQRRRSAPQRIGCAYQVLASELAPGVEPAKWLPEIGQPNSGLGE